MKYLLKALPVLGAIIILISLIAASPLQAAVVSFNSTSSTNNIALRNSWLAAIGESPDFLLDFESGYSVNDDISTGAPAALIPGGLSFDQGIIVMGAGSIDGSNPIDSFAPILNNTVTLSFSSDTNYFGFHDIDYGAGNIELTLEDGSKVNLSRDTTSGSGDSAEFFGIYSNNKLIASAVFSRTVNEADWGLDNLEYGLAVPVPSAAWLFGSALGLIGWMRRKTS